MTDPGMTILGVCITAMFVGVGGIIHLQLKLDKLRYELLQSELEAMK